MTQRIVFRVIPSLIVAMLIITLSTVSTEQLPTSDNVTSSTWLPPSLVLLGSGARWAANNGSSALFINWKDNWLAHHSTDGATWGPWPSESWPYESRMDVTRFSVSKTLEKYGFIVNFSGDIPETLNLYDLVVIEAYYAVEPKHEPLLRNYIHSGGAVVILKGVPPHFITYDKDMWTTTNLSAIQEWFGCRSYMNAGGYAYVIVDNPFNTTLLAGNTLVNMEGHSRAGVTGMNNDTKVVAQWGTGVVFAFTHEYGDGKVYYQAEFDAVSINATIRISPRTLNLKSKGKWITCYIKLSGDHNANDIDVSTILLNGSISAEIHPTCVHNEDRDGNDGLMVKFERSKVIQCILENSDHGSGGTQPLVNTATIVITGNLIDGPQFLGFSTIRVLHIHHACQAFGSRPSHSHWNPNADINGDNIVELMDFWIISQHFGESM